MSENIRIQEKISRLLEKAAHPGTPEGERAVAQEMADRLMAKHKIERAMINWERPLEERRKPTHTVINPLTLIEESSMRASQRDIAEHYIQGELTGLRSNILRFVGLRVTCQYVEEENGYREVAVGYEEDIFYGQLLWNTVFQDIVSKMFPGWSQNLSMEENVYRLKKAGYSWSQIREIGLHNGAKDAYGVLTEKNAGSKLRSSYGRWAVRQGESKKAELIRDPHWWRRTYVFSYSSRISQRLAAMKAGREEYKTENLPALQADQDLIDEHLYELYPHLRPVELTPEQKAEREREYQEELKREKNRKSVSKPRAMRGGDRAAWEKAYGDANRVDLSRTESFEGKRKELN